MRKIYISTYFKQVCHLSYITNFLNYIVTTQTNASALLSAF